MDVFLFLLELLAIVVFASAVGLAIGWLILKLAVRIFGEDGVLKPFEFIEGLYEDLGELYGEWRDIRRERREREARRQEDLRRREEIIEQRLRESLAMTEGGEDAAADAGPDGDPSLSKGEKKGG